MLLVTFATREEADASIILLNACASQNHFVFDKGILLITGIGPFAAYTEAEPFMAQTTTLYNFGIAGSLNPNFPAGSHHTIAATSKHIMHPKKHQILDPITLAKSGAHLCTVDAPLYNTPLKEKLQASFDLVDMEGYAFALLAKRYNRPCHLVKVVSDFCDEKTSAQIQKELGAHSLLLATLLQEEIDKLPLQGAF